MLLTNTKWYVIIGLQGCTEQQKGGVKMINTAKIKGRMAELGLTQSDVAKALGLSPSTVSQKINNVRALSLDEAEKLSALLNIDVGDFGEFFCSPRCIAQRK